MVSLIVDNPQDWKNDFAPAVNDQISALMVPMISHELFVTRAGGAWS